MSAGSGPAITLPAGLLPPNRRLVGVDCGGSASRVVVADRGAVTARPGAEPMNALLTSDVPDRLAALAAINSADALGVGMPGIRTETDGRELAASVAARCGRAVAVVPDAEAARLGAFLGGPGVVVAAGTGSVAIGWNGHASARAGGHGYLVGDDGGAYWIGREAVRSMLRWRDGGGGSPAFATAVADAAALDPDALVRVAHRRPTDRSLFARLAPVVSALAGEDPEAARIATEAARHLADLADAVRGRLGPLPVAGLGGVLSAPAVWEPFAARCHARRPLALPEVGALLVAARALQDQMPS